MVGEKAYDPEMGESKMSLGISSLVSGWSWNHVGV